MGIKCYNTDNQELTHLTQWDVNQKIIIKYITLGSTPEVHFSNANSKHALVTEATYSANTLTVEVPNILLQEGLTISLYVYELGSGNSAKTTHIIKIPVIPRAKPDSYTYTDNAYYIAFDNLKSVLDSSVSVIDLASKAAERATEAAEAAEGIKDYVDDALATIQIDTINPLTINGAVVESFYNPEIADIVTEKYIDQSGKAQYNNGYQYFKVKLYSGKKYRTNITNIYSLIVFENNEFDGSKGTVVHYEAVGKTQAFEIPEMNNKIVDVYITCQPKYFRGDKTIVVEGEELPVGTEQYKISFPWLTIDEEAEGFIEPITIDGAVVENFYNPEIAAPVTGKYIDYTNGKIVSSASYMYCKVKLLSGKKYCSNLGYSVAVFDNGKDDGTGNLIFIQNLGTSKVFEIPERKEKVVTAYFSFTISSYNNKGGKFVVVEGETAPTGEETYKITFPWLDIGEDETGDTGNADITNEINDIVDPMLIEGAVVENFYNPDNADIVEGKFLISTTGKPTDSNDYMYFKVKLYSGRKYRINIGTVYSIVVFDDGETSGNVVYKTSQFTSKQFEIPEMTDKIVTAYISCLKTQYNASNVKGNVIIVEGDNLPTGNEVYGISFPWLSISKEEEKEEENEVVISPYSVDEVKLKQKMPPYLFDGFEMDNYFDADYMVANSTEDSTNKKYANTPYIYLPSGTYTISECYSYTLMSKYGEKGETVRAKTFTLTEEYPYISFLILSQVSGVYDVNYLRKISIQKGDTATNGVPHKYKLSDKFDITDIVREIANEVKTPYPTHWQGKKYVAIGDSITRGYAPKDVNEGITTGGAQIANPYSKIVSDNLNMERLNLGEDGSNVRWVLGLNDSHRKQLEQAIEFAPDLVTIMLGVNDSGNDADKHSDLGTIDDVYDESNITFYSGLSEIVSRLQTALPNATIILLSSPKNSYTVQDTKQSYFKAVKDIAEKYDVLFYDMYNAGCGFNSNNETVVTNFVLTDVHPNEKAHKIIGSRLTGFIASH